MMLVAVYYRGDFSKADAYVAFCSRPMSRRLCWKWSSCRAVAFSYRLSHYRKFTPAGTSIVVRVSAAAGRARVEVSDEGPGVPEDKAERIFERFYQIDSGLSSGVEGSGIGLALARDLARLQGGEVRLDPTFESGAKFVWSMPCERYSRSPALAAPAPEATAGDDRPRRVVLVVEDNGDLRSYIAGILEDRYVTLVAENGAQGLKLAGEHIPDLIITDLMMPVMDGLAMLEALRRDPETEAIPVILLTARGGHPDEIRGLATGADDFIAKPFNREVLRARVDARMEAHSRLIDAIRHHDSETPDADDRLAEARRVVTGHLDDESFDVTAFADAMHLSRSALHRWLSERGTSPGTFIKETRLTHAARLLGGGHQVSEISVAVGFSNLGSFSRAFKAAYGMTPSEYQRGAVPPGSQRQSG